jgi:hypothetical protein
MSRHYATPAGDAAVDALRACFEERPVVVLSDLCRALHASARTVFRVLNRVGYLTSFSHTGRYFTLQTVPRFDERGLWFYEGVGFSRQQTLRATLVRLVKQSVAGATHDELQAIVRLRVHDTLRLLVRAGLIRRELVEPLFVYLDSDSSRARSQLARRHKMVSEQDATPPLDPARVIEVLLSVIRRPHATPGQIAEALSLRGLSVAQAQVEQTFARYELGKKTASSRSTRSKR